MFLGHNGIVNEHDCEGLLTDDSLEFDIATEDSADGVIITKFDKVYEPEDNITKQSKIEYDMSD